MFTFIVKVHIIINLSGEQLKFRYSQPQCNSKQDLHYKREIITVITKNSITAHIFRMGLMNIPEFY